MAGIGFELRKLYRKQGLVSNVKAYAYSTMTTVGPMILCLILVFVQQFFMATQEASYLQNELFIATLAYCFIFSIVLTSGLSIIVTRFIADRVYEKKYEDIINAYYGSLFMIVPIASIIAILFLIQLEQSFFYKFVAYLYFVELVVIWMQNVFLSALKEYKRIFRSFAVAVILSILTSYLLYQITSLEPVIIALLGMNIGFSSILCTSSYHFEQVFPRNKKTHYFDFLVIVRRYPTLFVTGVFTYSSVYVHNLVYWFFSDTPQRIAEHFLLMPFYDVAVFYAYLSVLPSLIFFVVIIETDFYERFFAYYKNVTEGGTYENLQLAKKQMQKTLIYRVGFLAEIQLLFTTLSIAIGLTFLPKVGFSIQQLDVFLILCFAYFFFILMFVLLHILMYFDDQKGILYMSSAFVAMSILFTFITMKLQMDGIGMFLASFIGLCLVLSRLFYILKNIDYYTYCPQPIFTFDAKGPQKSSRRKKNGAVSIMLLTLLLIGCSDETIEAEPSANVQTGISTTITIDDKRIYERDEDASVKTFYMTVLPDSDNPELDWYALNRIVYRYSEDNLKIILAEGEPDGVGPKPGMFGAEAKEANAKVSLRGNSARNSPQKSYKINLLDSAGTWHDQTTINLNKHLSDDSRLRNKLSFDLMEKIPNITGLRTQFIHLYVKDATAGDTTYKDYGLYTHVEQPNKRFLRSHLLDENGYLYKVAFFEFGRYPDQIKSHTDKTYDKEAFETILEIKGREEHDKLIQLLNDINNYNIPIEQVVEHYFVEDNLLTWLAINILMDNMDTDANNYYLYSPLNSEKWLILPWDYDGGWNAGRKNVNFHHPYLYGISNYWGNILSNRYFRHQSNVDKLSAKIEELYEQYINEQTVTELLSRYGDIPKQHLVKNPDAEYLSMPFAQYDKELADILATPAKARKWYYEDLQHPKPFYQSETVVLENNEHVFSWEESFDLQGDTLYYTATVARDPAMQNVVAHIDKTRLTELRTKKLPAGTYYYKVVVEDSEGHTKGSFDIYRDRENGIYYFGVLQVEVK